MNEEQPRSQAADTPEATQQTPPVQSAGIAQPVVSSSKGPNKRLIGLIAGIALVLLGAGAVWFFVMRDQSGTEVAGNNQPAQETQETAGLAQGNLIFTRQNTVGDSAFHNVYVKSLSDGAEVKHPEADSYASAITVHEDQVAFATEARGDKAAFEIWHSADKGRTVQKIFTPTASSTETLDQVTSLIFSDDGKTLLAGVLYGSDGKNRVTEIDLETKTATELFVGTEAGVYLSGYNRSKSQVVYREGCVQCDGWSNKILKRELGDGTITVLFDGQTDVSSAISPDGTTLLVSYGTYDPDAIIDGLGIPTKAPYSLEQISIEDGSRRQVASQDTPFMDLGFTNENQPYYVSGKQVVGLSGDDNEFTIFESERDDVYEVYYASAEGVVLSLGSYEQYTVYSYLSADKSFTELLQGTFETRVFGVTVQ